MGFSHKSNFLFFLKPLTKVAKD